MVIPFNCYLSWGLAHVMHVWERGQIYQSYMIPLHQNRWNHKYSTAY